MAHKLVGPKRSRAQLDEPFTDGSHDRPEALSHGLLNGLLTKIKKKKVSATVQVRYMEVTMDSTFRIDAVAYGGASVLPLALAGVPGSCSQTAATTDPRHVRTASCKNEKQSVP